jgi:hypothetical protein
VTVNEPVWGTVEYFLCDGELDLGSCTCADLLCVGRTPVSARFLLSDYDPSGYSWGEISADFGPVGMDGWSLYVWGYDIEQNQLSGQVGCGAGSSPLVPTSCGFGPWGPWTLVNGREQRSPSWRANGTWSAQRLP